ncbi:hypothetical protein [Flavilitoribacter nigricans]|uniref:Uncharacterized protein n=1 Tax=Flavilitoribacter nigricans (strain ATCC 23147 / DSM 23189 / NBRC 102662 / NCIMB 1420 / SS-2) TaxID=1122177 RepID=A0A2D0MY47_FLAN2|nr:hypothetical protein [Flavilitoribacter nigricans]PHN01202.1 hypothetical protein CRP01_38325 [Flavilitoribacter nigricans DSM 23189 = NBRC 102662]
MSRSIAILLLTCFLFPLLGHIVLFKIRRGQLRHELKEKLEHSVPRGELELISIPAEWMEHPPAYFQRTKPNEFRLHGEMFDIVHREARADTLLLYCLADKAETLLFTRLDEWVKQQHSKDPFQRGQTLQWERLLDSLFPSLIATPGIADAPSGPFLRPPYRFSCSPWEREAIHPPPEA